MTVPVPARPAKGPLTARTPPYGGEGAQDQHAPGTALVLSEEIAARLERSSYLARGALAPETQRAMAKGSAAWAAWCSARDACSLPAQPELVADYVDDLAAQGRKVAGIRQAVWAIGALHRAAGYTDPTKAEAVRFALKRVSRVLTTRQRQAAPIGADDARMILRLAGTKPAELRDLALLLVMRDLLARRSEVVALQVEDVTFAADGSATVLIRRSKTDQAGQGEVRWLSPRAVTYLRQWLAAVALTEGAIFRAVNKAGKAGEALAASEVSRILKRLAERAGLDPAAISGHSCRVGMAQDLVASGAELPAVMQAGRWKSPTMPARYAEGMLAGRGAVARFYERREK